MDKKTALITGATRGLGFAISEQLATKGYKVVMACREKATGGKSVEKLRSKGLDAELLVCDVGNVGSINKAAGTASKKYPVIDILINNAGISGEPMSTTIETIDLKIYQHIMDVNVRGAIWMISKFLPMLKKSKEARIINFSSGLAQLSVPRMGPQITYSISKTAVNQLTWTFADHLKDTNVKIFCVDPGWVKTDMGGPNAMLEISEGIDTPVWLATEDITKLRSGLFYKERKVLPW
jgi:NAD(P)-dependent dehydrogenase (short-subunit alcohol dehydrogenase family)